MSDATEDSVFRRGEALESLRKIPLFSQVSDEVLAELASHLIERRYPKNSTIVEEGLGGDYMYVIREGRVKVTKASEDGREKIMNFLEAGDFFGEMSLLDSQPRTASVKTLQPARLLALSRRDLMASFRKSPDLALGVIEELVRRLRETNEQASSMSFQRVKARAMGLLERIAQDEAGRRLTPALTHQQIADMIGTSRETVTRVVKQLKHDAWLGQEGKRYVIEDRPSAGSC
jgi:CRP-like cAMP-binding protein